jgi:mannan endo-1,4-beta-mannosidase
MLAAACGSSPRGASSPSPTLPQATTAPSPAQPSGPESSPPPVPQSGTYLGAWVNPAKGSGDEPIGGNTNAKELAQLPSFKRAISAAPAIVSVYTPWQAPAPISTLQGIVDQGAIPLVAWGCASTASISAGQYDRQISSYAQSLKAFARPVFLRWFWEMNLGTAKDVNCRGSAGPAGFVTAWRHIWDIFQQAGATNVAFVWCPGITGGLAKMAAYFPGVGYVNWIGVDGYDRRQTGAAAFTSLFGAWYATYSADEKPLMIAETGAEPIDQAAYLQGIESSLPTQFPEIKALVYFDAPGPAGSWALVGSGLDAFHRLATDPYFSARP